MDINIPSWYTYHKIRRVVLVGAVGHDGVDLEERVTTVTARDRDDR